MAHIRIFLEACAKRSPSWINNKTITASLYSDFGGEYGKLYSFLSELLHVPDDIVQQDYPDIDPRSVGGKDWGNLKHFVSVLQPLVPQAWKDYFGNDELKITRDDWRLVGKSVTQPLIYVYQGLGHSYLTYFY